MPFLILKESLHQRWRHIPEAKYPDLHNQVHNKILHGTLQIENIVLAVCWYLPANILHHHEFSNYPAHNLAGQKNGIDSKESGQNLLQMTSDWHHPGNKNQRQNFQGK